MNQEQWARLREAFERLCELPETEWEAALASSTLEPVVRERLLQMLRADRAGAVPDRAVDLAPGLHQQLTDSPVPDDRVGERFGAWRVVGSLGVGGMGKVYRAVRDDGRYEAEAAIKVVGRGIDARQFLHERNVLARLQHPNIARLLDGGEDDAGRPFLVMELVEGRTIDDQVAEKKLSQRQVLGLMLDAADAVGYAHARAVLHRDIKPDNVMVDDAGRVKLLDFGVAKLLDADSDDTRTTAAYFTPRFAAPEQLAGDAATTATDVFSLALLLYELLSGQHPFGVDGEGDLTRRMLTVEAAPLRRALRRAGRDGDLGDGQLRDLESLLARALQNDATRRLQSVDVLADELRRILSDLPIRSRRIGLSERAWRWSRRNRLAATTALLGLLALLAGSGIALWQAHEAREQRDTALQEARRAERVAEFLTEVFRAPNPSQARGETITARELLDHNRERIAEDLSDDPRLRQRLQAVIGDTYRSLGLYKEAEEFLEEAVLQAGDDIDPGLLANLGWVHAFQGRYEDSERRLAEAMSRARSTGDKASFANAQLRRATPLMNLSRFDEAESCLREVLAYEESLPTPDTRVLLSVRELLANIAYFRGDLDAAEAEYEAALRFKVERHGPVHIGVALTLSSLGTVMFKRGDFEGAERRYREAADTYRASYGVNNDQVAAQFRNQSLALRRLQRYDESLAAGRKAVAMLAQWSGAEHPRTLQARIDLLELELLLERDATSSWDAVEAAEAGLAPGSRLACRLASLRQWVASVPDVNTARQALDCLIADHAPEALLLVAELALARAARLHNDHHQEAVAALRQRLQGIEHPDPLLRAAAHRVMGERRVPD
ncbi:MAG: serine/threonine-protein kinase [Lysobacteraceae bacterium]